MKYWRLSALILLLALFYTSNIFSAPSPVVQVKVHFDSKAQLMELLEMGLDRCALGENYVEIITSSTELEKIQAKGFRTEVVHADLVKFYQSRLDPSKDMGGYMTLSEINAAVDDLVANHPDIVSAKYNLGQTIEGRDMWAFKISDNPNVDEDEVEVLFTAAIHAREVITPLVVLNFANYIVDNYATDAEIQYLVDNREIWIVPCVNPDGYYYNEVTDPLGGGMWRKNRRDNPDTTFGVDLNRNYGYKWGYPLGSSSAPGSEVYRGIAPWSEPEIQNMRDFHLAHDFTVAVYFHSCGNEIIWSYGYDYYLTPDHDLYQAMADSCSTWNGYITGTIARLLYLSCGGSDDWAYAEQTLKNKTFTFSFEVGSASDSFWPATSRIPELINENLNPMLYLTEIADHIYVMRPPKAPSVSVIDSTNVGEEYNVSWNLEDMVNPPVAYELQQVSGLRLVTDSGDNFNNFLNDGLSISDTRSHSGLHSFYGGAESYTYHYIQYDFPRKVQEGDSLMFYTWYEIESNFDYAYVEVSTDGDNYITIPGNITTTYDPNDLNKGNGITGSSGGWVPGKFSLEDFVGENIIIRLSYSTDLFTLEEGIYFDDIFPVSSFTGQKTFSFSSEITSHQFSQIHAGTYQYKVRAKDAEDQWSRFSPASAVRAYRITPYTCGDANGDDAINVSDAVYIINYVFVGGAIPDPIEAADANCDSSVNVSDAVYIINYVFVGGNDPCDMNGDGIPDCE